MLISMETPDVEIRKYEKVTDTLAGFEPTTLRLADTTATITTNWTLGNEQPMVELKVCQHTKDLS